MTISLELQEQLGKMPNQRCWLLRASVIVSNLKPHFYKYYYTLTKIPLSVARLGRHPYLSSNSIYSRNHSTDPTAINMTLLWLFIVPGGESLALTSDGASYIQRYNN